MEGNISKTQGRVKLHEAQIHVNHKVRGKVSRQSVCLARTQFSEELENLIPTLELGVYVCVCMSCVVFGGGPAIC